VKIKMRFVSRYTSARIMILESKKKLDWDWKSGRVPFSLKN